ncbi:MAG: hypothetical protein LPK09_10715 [Hymenobacteraceae bacterium]|nr:hypothetical protein [Hymenobacteraceae bacterium]
MKQNSTILLVSLITLACSQEYGLYFAYADAFPLNDQLDTPSRMLVMKMGDKMVYLWCKEVDLFGCSCL